AVCGRTDQRLGDDRSRPPAMGRLPGDAHLAGGHGRRRDPGRLRHARPGLRTADRRRRLDPLAARPQAPRARTGRGGGGGGLMLPLSLIPLVFALMGLAFYTVLGGADFGAGFWQLTAGRGRQAERVREHAHAAMAPVWEANHVWLIFVLTVVWTAYPTAFGSIASTLSIPLFIAAVGIIFRGVAYALRAGATGARELSAIDTVFSLSSVLTPFALGAAVGGIASGRVPVGNAAGDPFTS